MACVQTQLDFFSKILFSQNIIKVRLDLIQSHSFTIHSQLRFTTQHKTKLKVKSFSQKRKPTPACKLTASAELSS